MLSFFPTPYPDELLYSVIARYHIRSGNTSPKMTMIELFGARTVTAVVDMPSCIDALVERIPKEKGIRAINLIMNNTLFPYYTAFMDEVRSKAVVAAMLGNKGGSIHTMTGIMASTISTPDYLRYCPVCLKEDKVRYGECYWHRLHQIPGVILCPIHNTLILDSTVNLARQNKHEFIAAYEGNCVNRSVTVKYSDVDLKRILKLSRDIEWINKHYDVVQIFIENKNGLRNSYLSVLKEKGYATANGRVYQESLISDFIKFYGYDYLKTIQSEVEYGDEGNWLSNIVRKHRKSFHPLRHLLLMSFLSGSSEEFFANKNTYMPFGKGPWPCLNSASGHYRKLIIRQVTITHCCDTKLPVGTFECSCGFIYSRRGPDPAKDNLYKIGRIKQFGPVWEEKLSDLVENKKLGLREIARHLGVDPKTVKAYSQKLGLMLKWNGVCGVMTVIAKESDDHCSYMQNDRQFDVHRKAWIAAMKDNPEASKTELRKLTKAHYTWLYRHDKEWLDKNSPRNQKAPVNDSRIDWKVRDAEVVQKVRSVVKEILGAEGKPVRISLSRLGKLTGLSGLLEKHLDKMPQTKEYVESVIEDDSEYRRRRIRCAIWELYISAKEPKVWIVMRKAGIRSEYLQEVISYILDQININNDYETTM